MGNYVPNTPGQQQEMLEAMGLCSFDELYKDVPAAMRAGELNLPSGLSELEVREKVEEIASKNRKFSACFRGAGSYDHYIPAIVKTVTSKEEFVTAYTPYQAEISQGILQSIFEYQTMVCELLGMEVSNACVYDGGTAAAEAVMMCEERKKTGVVISGAVNPEVIGVVKTYCESRSVPVTVVPAKDGKTDSDALREALTGRTASVLFQQPAYSGQIEDAGALCALVHEAGAKVIMSVNPIAMGLLKTPGECGADIAVAEGQPLGMPLGYGGPYLGLMAATKGMMRKLPGRIVGETKDNQGRRTFVLTLQAREQHIRREKASSNICSNEALCAMTASVYLASMGPDGLKKCAQLCMNNAHYAAAELAKIPGVKLVHSGPFFHEFVTELPVPAEKIEKALAEHGILGGLPTEEGILWCATEKCGKEKIDRMVSIVKEVCEA